MSNNPGNSGHIKERVHTAAVSPKGGNIQSLSHHYIAKSNLNFFTQHLRKFLSPISLRWRRRAVTRDGV